MQNIAYIRFQEAVAVSIHFDSILKVYLFKFLKEITLLIKN